MSVSRVRPPGRFSPKLIPIQAHLPSDPACGSTNTTDTNDSSIVVRATAHHRWSAAIGAAEVVRRAAVHEQFGVTRGTMRTLTVLR